MNPIFTSLMLQKPDFGQIFALEAPDIGLIVKYHPKEDVLELQGFVVTRETLVVDRKDV